MAKKLKILVVEDEFLTGFDIITVFSNHGCECIGPVSTGNEAMDIMRIENIDVILIDIGLPGGINGIELAKHVVKDYSTKIIFMTGYADEILSDELSKISSLGLFSKPINYNKVINLLKKEFSF